MIIHEPTPMFENYNHTFISGLEYRQLFKELIELENQKATDVIPHTVAHYISPQSGDVSISNQVVAEVMQSFGMDVIQIYGDQLAEEEGIEENLGLILEHQADSETVEFDELVEDMKIFLHQLGWKYDGWVGEVDQPCTVH